MMPTLREWPQNALDTSAIVRSPWKSHINMPNYISCATIEGHTGNIKHYMHFQQDAMITHKEKKK